MVNGPAALASPGTCQKCSNSSHSSGPQKPNLQFNKIPGASVHSEVCEACDCQGEGRGMRKREQTAPLGQAHRCAPDTLEASAGTWLPGQERPTALWPIGRPVSQLCGEDSFGSAATTQREAPETGVLLGLAGEVSSDRWRQYTQGPVYGYTAPGGVRGQFWSSRFWAP